MDHNIQHMHTMAYFDQTRGDNLCKGLLFDKHCHNRSFVARRGPQVKNQRRHRMLVKVPPSAAVSYGNGYKIKRKYAEDNVS